MKVVKKSNEFLIGLFTCILLLVLYWGVNFLKGENLFSNKRFFYASYENIDGLTISRPVTVNGFKVGQVSNIMLNSHEDASLVVEIAIEEDILFSNRSVLEIYDADIMGTKSVQLKMVDGKNLAISGDTLIGAIASGLTSEMTEQFGSVKVGLDQLIISFDKVLHEINSLSSSANRILLNNEMRISNGMENIETVSDLIESHTNTIDQVLINLLHISDSISQIQFTKISDQMLNISLELESMVMNINNEKSTLGQLILHDSLYNQLSSTLNSMDQLLIDLKEDPKKYINISVFGGNKKVEK